MLEKLEKHQNYCFMDLSLFPLKYFSRRNISNAYESQISEHIAALRLRSNLQSGSHQDAKIIITKYSNSDSDCCCHISVEY